MTSFICIADPTTTTEVLISNLGLSVEGFNIMEMHSEEGKDIGIEKAKEIIRFTSKKPLSGTNKVILIYQAHKLTHEAQNALLKTLEEHADFINIILTTHSEGGLLETVVSRCKKVYIKDTKATIKNTKNTLSQLLALDLGHRSVYIAKLAKKEKPEILEVLHHWIREAQETQQFENAEKIIITLRDLENTNVNTRLALEVLAFNC